MGSPMPIPAEPPVVLRFRAGAVIPVLAVILVRTGVRPAQLRAELHIGLQTDTWAPVPHWVPVPVRAEPAAAPRPRLQQVQQQKLRLGSPVAVQSLRPVEVARPWAPWLPELCGIPRG